MMMNNNFNNNMNIGIMINNNNNFNMNINNNMMINNNMNNPLQFMNPFNNIDNIFPKNKIGTIEKYIELLKINENYFILTSTKLKKS